MIIAFQACNKGFYAVCVNRLIRLWLQAVHWQQRHVVCKPNYYLQMYSVSTLTKYTSNRWNSCIFPCGLRSAWMQQNLPWWQILGAVYSYLGECIMVSYINIWGDCAPPTQEHDLQAGVDSLFHYRAVITAWWEVLCFYKRWKDLVLLSSSAPHPLLMHASLYNSLFTTTLEVAVPCLRSWNHHRLFTHRMSLYSEHTATAAPCRCLDTRGIKPLSNFESIAACLPLWTEGWSTSAVESERPQRDFNGNVEEMS